MPLSCRDIRTGRDHDGLRLQRLRLAVIALHFDLAGGHDAAGAGEGIDLVLLEQKIDALHVAVDGLVLERQHRLQVELRLADPDAHVGEAVAGFLEQLRKAWSRAFEGMQPTLRQVPPCVARFSTTATFMPSCAARMAQT
jgi:hypothetical protein